MTRIRTYLPAAALALVAFVVRLTYSTFPRTVWGDEPFYLWLGRNWFRGDGYSFAFTGHWDFHHTPGYPFITAVLTPLAGSMQRASDWSYILFGVLLVLAVYALARRLFGPASGFAAGLITALAPSTALMPLYWGTMTEPPYLALALIGVWLAHRAYHRFRAIDVVLAGVFLALAYYVRPEAIVYVGAMGLVLGIRALAAPPRLRRLAYPALMGLVFLLLIFPYLFKVHQVTGTWTVSEKVAAHFATAAGLAEGRFQQFNVQTWGLDSTGNEVRFFSQETANASALAYIAADPVGYVKIVYGNTLRLLHELLSPRLLPPFALLFIGLALFALPWDRRQTWDQIFLLATLLPALSFVLFFVQERYIAPLVPTLFIWFGHGVMLAGAWLAGTVATLRSRKAGGEGRNGWSQTLLAWAPLALLAVFLVVWTPRQVSEATNPGSTQGARSGSGGAGAPDEAWRHRDVPLCIHRLRGWRQLGAHTRRRSAKDPNLRPP